MNSLDTLIDQSREARDQAGRVLAEERQGEAQSAAQLRTLEQYRADYGQRLQSAMNAGIDAARLGNYRQFIRALDDAIDKARLALQQHGERVAASREHWHGRQRQLASYNTLADRRAERARLEDQRREQRDSDERTTNAVARRPNR